MIERSPDMLNATDLAEEVQNDVPISTNLGTILIIEDDPRMQKTLERTFALEHYSTLIAGDGQEAIRLVLPRATACCRSRSDSPNYLGTRSLQDFQATLERDTHHRSQRDLRSRGQGSLARTWSGRLRDKTL